MRLPRLPLLLAAVLAFPAARARAQEGFAIPPGESQDPPTPARLQEVEAAAAAAGWDQLRGPLHAAAVQAYAHNRFVAAGAWYNAFMWANVFTVGGDHYDEGWKRAIMNYGVAYPAVAGLPAPGPEPLGTLLPDDLKAWVLGHPAFSEEFFSNLKPVDRLPSVLAILERLYRRSPGRFERYPSLAIAIALVYDVPPPPFWPHIQVNAAELARRLPDPVVTWDRLIHQDELQHTYFRISQLRAEELRFVVDTAAPPAELDWSEQHVTCGLDEFEEAYKMIAYRRDRAATAAGMMWSGGPYTLENILQSGGICIDQAYFATEAGKARGVPTLLFGGEGQDGRHAWFGYLDSGHHWKLDAGRYDEQRLVTGIAYDPQTWRQISDHELQFLSERFHALPSFTQSRVQQVFAQDFLGGGDAAAAARAARAAVNYERRNSDAWELLLLADKQLNLPAAEQEGVMREAALAFAPRYPDLVMSYVNRICASLRDRGETSRANYEEQGLARRLLGDRSDLAVNQAATILIRSLSTQPLGGQVATYNSILAQYGHGAGTAFFDQIVKGFAEHLAAANQKAQARLAVERARDALEVQPGTQIAMEVDALLTKLQD